MNNILVKRAIGVVIWLLLSGLAAPSLAGDRISAALETDIIGPPPPPELVRPVPLLPDVLLPFPIKGRTEHILLVEKSSQTLFLYAYDGEFKQLLAADCSTGKKSGRKQRAGDLKTPEGVYFFIERHADKDLAPIYGAMAFVTDYPNLMDQQAGRTGSAIWLHGTNRPLAPRDSSGCMALREPELKTVASYIRLNRTPLIVVKTLNYQPPDTESAEKLTDLALDWNAALEGGTYHDYLKHFSPEYLPAIGWWPEWNRLRAKWEAREMPLSVELADLSMFRHRDQYVLLFDQVLSSGQGRVRAGTRKLFLTKAGRDFRIVGERYQALPPGREVPEGEYPFLAMAGDLDAFALASAASDEKPGNESDAPVSPSAIQKLVSGWLAAWGEKDIQKYGRYYASDFRSRGMNRSQWLAYKDRLNRKYDYIRVSGSDLEIKAADNSRVVVDFVQRYESTGHQAVGIKRLQLKPENGQWKIFRETWRKR